MEITGRGGGRWNSHGEGVSSSEWGLVKRGGGRVLRLESAESFLTYMTELSL